VLENNVMSFALYLNYAANTYVYSYEIWLKICTVWKFKRLSLQWLWRLYCLLNCDTMYLSPNISGKIAAAIFRTEEKATQ